MPQMRPWATEIYTLSLHDALPISVCVMLMLGGVNVWVALVCAVAAGMLAGLVTGEIGRAHV